jgi:hypothetical protein
MEQSPEISLSISIETFTATINGNMIIDEFDFVRIHLERVFQKLLLEFVEILHISGI